MQPIQSLSFLRRVLLLDAVSCAGMGIGLVSMAPFLASLFGLPAELLRDAGFALLPFAAFVGFLGSRELPSRAGVWIAIALNALWMIDSIVLLLTGWVEPSALGYAFVVGQAVIVGVLAQLEYIGLRKAATVAA